MRCFILLRLGISFSVQYFAYCIPVTSHSSYCYVLDLLLVLLLVRFSVLYFARFLINIYICCSIFHLSFVDRIILFPDLLSSPSLSASSLLCSLLLSSPVLASSSLLCFLTHSCSYEFHLPSPVFSLDSLLSYVSIWFPVHHPNDANYRRDVIRHASTSIHRPNGISSLLFSSHLFALLKSGRLN